MNNKNISKVYLLSVPLENDYKHTLYFNSLDSQVSYFKSKKKYEFTDFTYQRKDNIIRVGKNYDSIYDCNYVMYQNPNVNNKWFYAFITGMEYKNSDTTELKIETDVIQTWLFDYEIKPSFVEREHVSDDDIGKNTIPEGLELGEYISNKHNKDDALKDNHKLVVSSTYGVDGMDDNGDNGNLIQLMGGQYGGIYTGPLYYTYENDGLMLNNILTKVLQQITDEKGQEAISCLFMAPEFLCTDLEGKVITNNLIPSSENHKYYDHEETKPFTTYGIDDYQPRNKKLFTYPYCYLHVDNGNGANAIYHYEYFKNNTMKFHVEGVLCPGCSIRMIPLDYKGSEYADREGLNLGKLPICNWSSDLYTNWITQNGVNVATSIGTAVGGTVMGAVSGALYGGVPGAVVGGIGGGISGVAQIANALNEVKKAEMIPPQTSGNINCGDVVTSANNNTFHYYHMSIKQEYAKIIDKYFDMFGYKVNDVKVPNKAHRSRYWYTKTIDINIDGALPISDLEKIKSCYNKGITFWRNASEIQNYDLSNGIAVVE